MPGDTLYLFGKHDGIGFIDYRAYLTRKARIVRYQPSRLAQGRVNDTSHHDMIYYFTKGSKAATFNLDDIRVPQLVVFEHRLRCEQGPSVTRGAYGKAKFHANGKNPGDVGGAIKQLTHKSKALVSRAGLNTIQKPLKLMERLVKASSNVGDVDLDPFCGVGTTRVACQLRQRSLAGFEQNLDFVAATRRRLCQLARSPADALG